CVGQSPGAAERRFSLPRRRLPHCWFPCCGGVDRTIVTSYIVSPPARPMWASSIPSSPATWPAMTVNLLHNPIWRSLEGPPGRHARGRGLSRHYSRHISPFSAIAEASSAAYCDLADDLPVSTEARLLRPEVEPLPKGWEEIRRFTLLQMVAQRPPQEVELS